MNGGLVTTVLTANRELNLGADRAALHTGHLHQLTNAFLISLEKVKARIESLEESNPIIGHCGCRLGITYPKIYDRRVRAVSEAACYVKKAGIPIQAPEIMIPLVGKVEWLRILKENAIAGQRL